MAFTYGFTREYILDELDIGDVNMYCKYIVWVNGGSMPIDFDEVYVAESSSAVVENGRRVERG